VCVVKEYTMEAGLLSFSGIWGEAVLLLGFLGTILPLLLAIAYFTLVERKIRAGIQRRQGPNVVGVYGLLQALADGLKLFLKETIIPTSANSVRFVLAPRVLFSLRLVGWAVIPVGSGRVFADVNLGVLYLFAVSALSVYGIIRAGWASNSKYAFLGSLRSAAQRVSYEVSIGFTRVTVLLCAGSLNLTEIVESQKNVWYVLPLLPSFLRFFISAVAETSRHPFDLPEAEAELVSGYNVEYSGRGFALFFLGETGNRLLRCATRTILFFGGWLSPLGVETGVLTGPLWFGLKATLFVRLFCWLRAAYPRYRYDQLRRLGWKVLLPRSLGWLLATAGILRGLDGLLVT
jgi:NADH-quinone oxidoreductase subunit H